jgi:hypothetical protein
MNTNTNHWWKDIKVTIKKGEVDVSLQHKAQTLQPVPTKSGVQRKPWTSDEIMFVIAVVFASTYIVGFIIKNSKRVGDAIGSLLLIFLVISFFRRKK